MAVTRVRPLDAIKTYRYLRIGIIAAIVLLATSILIESFRAQNLVTGAKWCLQTSISSYYYTPVRAILVGFLFVVGTCLIAYQGHDKWEDFFLNISGILAPIVAVVPTTDVGDCWSVAPSPLPVQDGVLAKWVVANIDNNIDALLIVAFLALPVAALIWRLNLKDPARQSEDQSWRVWQLALVAGLLVFVGVVKHFWRQVFLANAHGKSAILLFVFLWLAIEANIRVHKREPARQRWAMPYRAVSVTMVVGIPVSLVFGRHQLFALESWEIAAFAVYWLLQTFENWNERVMVRGDDDLVFRAA